MEVKISGIICDNKKCTYKNMSVPFSAYPVYVNKPCPLCGENLLTEKDYKKCLKVVRITKIVNYFNPFFYIRLLFEFFFGKIDGTVVYSVDYSKKKKQNKRANKINSVLNSEE